MNHWIYKKKPIIKLEDIPDYENMKGFVYCITNLDTGKVYFGKKALSHSRRTKISKREKISTQTKKVFKRTTKDSGWLNYWGSSLILKEDIKLYGESKFKREIIEFCKTTKYLSYLELVYQVQYDVLRIDSYNANILSRFFRKDMEENNYDVKKIN